MKPWSNLANVVYRRTYSRNTSIDNIKEGWPDTVDRVIQGNIRGRNVPTKEVQQLHDLMMSRKAIPAGRGLWFSGTAAHEKLGGTALNNCWYVNTSKWENFVVAQDLFMLGGGVGVSVEHRYSSKLPKVKPGVVIVHKATKDADFIVPDSREGWNELTSRALEAFFETGRGFTYSTICLRGYGEPIVGFGGTASGPIPLIKFIETLCSIMVARESRFLRPIDCADITTAIGEMVVSGNVRRTAIIILGDPWDKDYLKAKRWDLGPLPSHRTNANYSVVVEDAEDLVHPLFWKTFEQGEAFGILNRRAMRKYGRMGEKKADTAEGMNPCVVAGTEILTFNGYKPIDQLVGQEVEIWNGDDWARVTPKITGHNREVFKTSFSDGRSITCTDNHEFIVLKEYKGKNKPKIERVKLRDLQIGDKLAKFDYPVLADNSFAEHPEAYTQGFISAEGMDGYPYLYLYADKKKCLRRLAIRHERKPDKTGRIAVYPNFQPLSKVFVPMDWDTHWKLDWLAGLLDGDGCVLKEGGVQISSINRDFLLRTQKMLTLLGTQSKVGFGNPKGFREMPDGKNGIKEYFCQEGYRLHIGATEMQFLQSLGLQCTRLKIQGFKPNRNAGRYVCVTDIESAGIADTVYCFTELQTHRGCFDGVITGQCGEATLEPYEPCNLTEIALPNLDNEEEFLLAARLMHRYAKRATMEKYHHEQTQDVVNRNRRIGSGITGCLASHLFTPTVLDRVYEAIQDENKKYSKELKIPESIRTTVVKPSGTVSKVLDMQGYEGIHPAYSRYITQRIRFASNDPLIPVLREAGHTVEPLIKLDGILDHGTLVVDFYQMAPKGYPVADENFDTWEQLKVYKIAQKHWADQAVSVSVYYKREEIPKIKEWLMENIGEIKSISFLAHSGHGYTQAPKEAITAEMYEKLSAKIKPIDADKITGDGLESQECDNGACPIK